MTNRMLHATPSGMHVDRSLDNLGYYTNVVIPSLEGMSRLFGEVPCCIRKVRDEYGCLGNMSPHPVLVGTVVWPTAEALFQAARFMPGSHMRARLMAEKNPMKAKMMAKASDEPRQVQPLSDTDVKNMLHILTLKYRQHASVRETLAATGKRCVVEDVSGRRNRGSAMFWGMARNEDGSWEGQNWLGVLWMCVRETETVIA